MIDSDIFDFSRFHRLSSAISGEVYYVRTELEFINNFDAEIDRYLVNKFVDVATKGDDAILSAPKHARETIQEDVDEELLMITDSMPFLLRHSLFISQYSLLETHINALCRILKRHKRSQVDVSDLAGAGIVRGKTYLEKVMNIDFPAAHHTWRNLLMYNQLRNVMVHANGETSETDNKKVIKYIISHPFLELSPLNRILVLGDFIREVASNIIEFSSLLSAKIVEKHDP